MARHHANALALHEMGASWDGREIPLHRRYLRVPMGHWPWRPGCHCPKCGTVLNVRSEVGWCIICGSFGCSFCCDVVEWRRNRKKPWVWDVIKPTDDWLCATWRLVLQGQGRPCAPGWRTRAVHVCFDMSCRRKYELSKKRIGEHGIDLQLDWYWK